MKQKAQFRKINCSTVPTSICNGYIDMIRLSLSSLALVWVFYLLVAIYLCEISTIKFNSLHRLFTDVTDHNEFTSSNKQIQYKLFIDGNDDEVLREQVDMFRPTFDLWVTPLLHTVHTHTHTYIYTGTVKTYTVNYKKRDILFLTITFANLNRFF